MTLRLRLPGKVRVCHYSFGAGFDGPVASEREARAASSLNHPLICAIYDVGSENGIDYLVMELLEGETAADSLARGPMPVADVLRIGAQMADALDRVHRDLQNTSIPLS